MLINESLDQHLQALNVAVCMVHNNFCELGLDPCSVFWRTSLILPSISSCMPSSLLMSSFANPPVAMKIGFPGYDGLWW